MKETVKLLQEKCRELEVTIGSVESFTGGEFAHTITSVPGASHFFKGALVTYATEEKNRLLGISYHDIDVNGVVSSEISRQMADLGRKKLNVDYCISFTGNAGPEVLEKKEAGEIYIAISTYEDTQVYEYHLKGKRREVQHKAILIALDLLLSQIEKINIQKEG